MAPSMAFLRRPILSPFADKGHNLAARGITTLAQPWQPIPMGEQPETPSLASLISRRSDSDDGSDNMINLMLIILGIVFFALILVSLLFFFRRSRRLQRQRQRNEALPTYDDIEKNPKQHGLTIETTHNGRSSVYVIGRDGQPMLQKPNLAPDSPDNVPEIRITFPDEQDENGRHTSGRVLLVRVGDNAAVGLEPMQDEQLPAYEKESKSQFHSIDMDQIGGLKEKDPNLFK